MRHRRRVDEREQNQNEIERVHRQRTIMLRPRRSDERSQRSGRDVSSKPETLMPGGRAANYFSVESPAVAPRPLRQISLFSLSLPPFGGRRRKRALVKIIGE
jgi:hypothetical protein